MRFLVLLCAVLATACSSSGGGRIGDVAPINSHSVVFLDPSDFNEEDREQVLEAIGAHLSAWETDFRPLQPTTIQVLDEDEFIYNGVSVTGWTKSDGTIIIATGDRNSLPALFHEFCHRGPASSFYGLDPYHDNPAWTSWTERSHRIAAALADRR